MKESVTIRTMAEPLLFWLDIVGCSPKNQTKYALLRWFIMASFSSAFLVLITGHMLQTLANGITFESVEDVMNCFLLFQFVFKYFFFRLNYNKLSAMLDVMYTKFWLTNEIDDQTKRFKGTYELIYRVMDLYRKSYIVMNAAYSVEPLLYRKGLLRIPIWLPNREILNYSPYYELIYIYELVNTLSADFVMLNFELMSLLLLSTAYVQLEMIKAKLRKIGKDNFTYDTFKGCVEHHILVLGHVKDITSTLSLTMLQQVVTYFMAICLPAYLFTSTGTVNIGFCICTIINILNFYLYCLIGQYLYDQCLSVADAVYNSDWWNLTDLKLRNSMIIIMNQSTRGIKLTAGGLLDFTLITFMQAVKLLFSTLQFLRNSNERSLHE